MPKVVLFRVKIGHFELVMVSTASLEMKSWDERSYERTTQFLQSMKEGMSLPVQQVRLTCLPLQPILQQDYDLAS